MSTTTTQQVQKNVSTKLNANTFTRENYRFDSWNTKSDGTGIRYEDESNITTSIDTTLYAQWIQTTRPVEYNLLAYSTDYTCSKRTYQDGCGYVSCAVYGSVLEWIGSASTTTKIAYNGSDDSKIFGTLNTETNWFKTETKYVNVNNQLIDGGLQKNTEFGYGGACLYKVTPKLNKFITKIELSPYASSKNAASTTSPYTHHGTVVSRVPKSGDDYADYNVVYDHSTSNARWGILSFGPTYICRAKIIDNGNTYYETITQSTNTYPLSKWYSTSSESARVRTDEKLTFDFGPYLNNYSINAKTQELCFYHVYDSKTTIGCIMCGLKVYSC